MKSIVFSALAAVALGFLGSPLQACDPAVQALILQQRGHQRQELILLQQQSFSRRQPVVLRQDFGGAGALNLNINQSSGRRGFRRQPQQSIQLQIGR